MSRIGKLGEKTILYGRYYAFITAVSVASLRVLFTPRLWRRTTRGVLTRQILFTGIESVPFISFIAVLVGISIVLQAQVWLSKVGQTGLLGPILIAVVVRELGPLLTNFVVIGRSGAAITTELGNMKVNHEIEVLDAQGIDPFLYLVVPRVIGMMVSMFCLTVVFIVISFISGYLFGDLLSLSTGTPQRFFGEVLKALTPADVINVLAKTLIPGLLIGAITCTEGLRIKPLTTQVPQAVTRALVRSVAALFIISAVVSLLTYF